MENTNTADFVDIYGREDVKRACQVTAAGRHNLLLVGPPGVGKSMVARRLPGILPDLSDKEMEEAESVCNDFGLDFEEKLYRAPHYRSSEEFLIDEMRLANNGILFLDELPKFNLKVQDSLREPLEKKHVTVENNKEKIDYPTDFLLVAAMTPCKCGYYGDPIKKCTCSSEERYQYLQKLSGIVLDKIEIFFSMKRLMSDSIQEIYQKEKNGEQPISSKELKEGVLRAKKLQDERYKDLHIRYNSELTPNLIAKYCPLDNECKSVMEAAFSRFNLSARQYHRVIKVARTIADLDGSENIKESHLLEALSYSFSNVSGR